jgi:hypothetical protein
MTNAEAGIRLMYIYVAPENAKPIRHLIMADGPGVIHNHISTFATPFSSSGYGATMVSTGPLYCDYITWPVKIWLKWENFQGTTGAGDSLNMVVIAQSSRI